MRTLLIVLFSTFPLLAAAHPYDFVTSREYLERGESLEHGKPVFSAYYYSRENAYSNVLYIPQDYQRCHQGMTVGCVSNTVQSYPFSWQTPYQAWSRPSLREYRRCVRLSQETGISCLEQLPW